MRPDLQPMLASLADAPLDDPQLVYEPKYDGIRAIAEVTGGPRARVHLWSRLGNEKTRQFPEIVAALEAWARRLKQPVVIDGEIVALDANGEPIGFQALQGRIHLHDAPSAGPSRPSRPSSLTARGAPPPLARAAALEDSLSSRGPQALPSSRSTPTAFIAFDLLRDGTRDLRELPLLERRAALERVFGKTRSPILRMSEQVRGNGRALYERALSSGWEGLIAKHVDSRYKSGKRTPDWRKLKIVQEQEFVIGGWTEPRHTRTYFGALLLGVYDADALVYAGHTGTGFNEKELARVMKLLKPLETRECPFRQRPKTNEKPHWVRPELVAQIKFTEWTTDGKLRHPVYLGLRDDKKPTEVSREQHAPVRRSAYAASGSGSTQAEPRTSARRARSESAEPRTPNPKSRTANPESRIPNPEPRTPTAKSQIPIPESRLLLDELRAIEASRCDGTVTLPDGDTLSVSNLHKIFWPKQKLTKGDLLRYYAQVAPFILPAVDGRPLVMKRFPNGIGGQPFYQHRAPEHVPPGVRVERVKGDRTVPSRFIGGNLKTLLYMTQLAAISQDPWFSRVESPEDADYVALDLDPMPEVGFARVLDVARWIRDELAALGAEGVPKTSGADGLHVYIPLPPGTPYDAGLIFCQIVATVVANKHPKVATVERAVAARGKRVYVDYLQNIMGKTLATAYSARASTYAGVSTPLSWREIDEGVAREDFTIDTVPARLRDVGDLWMTLRRSNGIDLSRAAKYAEGRTAERTT